MVGLTYDSYLRLAEMLSLQQPLCSGTRRLKAAEHFFIVSHQASELWLRQVLLDLDAATNALRPPGTELELALEHLQRVARIAQLLVDHVALLGELPLSCFAQFRPRLGNASGAQSSQFHALEDVLGLHDGHSPLYEAFLSALEADGLTVRQLYEDELRAGVHYRIAETLLDVDQRLWRWQVIHLEVVARLIGDRPGTGGSSGVRHLVDRMSAGFPELWEARSALHEREDRRLEDSVTRGGAAMSI
jgi:tryptophan 2,3-dioxygenase